MSLTVYDLVSLLSNLADCRSFKTNSFDTITRSFLTKKIPLVKVEGGYRSIINEKYQIFSLDPVIDPNHDPLMTARSWYRVNGNKADLDIYQTCHLILSLGEKTINQYIWTFLPETYLVKIEIPDNNDLVHILTNNNFEITVSKYRLLTLSHKVSNYKISVNSHELSAQTLDYLLRVISTGRIKYEQKLKNQDLYILSRIFYELGFRWF